MAITPKCSYADCRRLNPKIETTRVVTGRHYALQFSCAHCGTIFGVTLDPYAVAENKDKK